jgi:hypothetical protein
VPRYDIPKAAPEPLRRVQLFVNSVDLSHEREWIADWLEGEDVRSTGEAIRRAQEVREALRELLYANNRQPGTRDPSWASTCGRRPSSRARRASTARSGAYSASSTRRCRTARSRG